MERRRIEVVERTCPFACLALLAAASLVLAACGWVITPQPDAGGSAGTSPDGAIPSLHATAPAPILPPIDTATPTVTPTPIIHVVQSGEILMNIALEYGVSVEAIQAANGIEDPRFLQVGQRLLIPTGQEEGEPASGGLLPTPTPLPLEVQGVAFYETPVGSLWCFGEVVNHTSVDLANVQVQILLFDAGGEFVGGTDVFADADLIPPQERAPFHALFVDPPAAWASSQVTVLRSEEAGALAASYAPIAVLEVVSQPAGPQLEVSGTVRNESAQRSAARVSVIVTTVDAAGLVTGARQGEVALEGPLLPGASAPFTLSITSHGEATADIRVVALGYVSAE